MKQLKLKNSPIYYYLTGKEHKEWILFLHAAFVDHRMFRTQIEYFAENYNVLTLDIIGHGQSTNAKKGDSIAKMSEWMLQILQEEGIAQIHIVGISLGCVLAQDFANRHPQAVSSLACFGGYNINNFDPSMQKKNGSAQMLMMLKALFSVKWFAQANKKISAHTTQAQNEFYELNLGFPKKSFLYLASLNSLIGNDQALPPRPYPLLIGCGQYDIPMELEIIKMWKDSEPDCKKIIFDGAGHCVNMDVPLKFNEELEKFWAAK
ncbi:MAG: alpha/beta hydrolase [Lachnospiraceae bacterium]|jgi:pimeloyl-ACP methyl ester carboxylesterase|nr:alpha/beta hydrolase [Lachnospiraceae bacterium]